MGKLTKAQASALSAIAKVNAKGTGAHKLYIRTTATLLERLEKAGLITSAGPFAFSYHTVHITDAGRRALAENQGEG